MCHARVAAATLMKIRQLVVNINMLEREDFVRGEAWLLFFIWREKNLLPGVLAAGWSRRFCSKVELFEPKLPFLPWKEGEEPGAARWRSRSLQKSRTIPQPSPWSPLGCSQRPPGAAQGCRAQ